jgi:hypothetical protein
MNSISLGFGTEHVMISNETHGTFDDILATATPELRSVCKALRSLIASSNERFVEVVWPKQKIASFGVGPKKMTEHYAYIGVQPSHVNLGFYHGISLPDPAGLLEGTGKELRHLKLRNVSEVKKPCVVALVREAISERRRQLSEA